MLLAISRANRPHERRVAANVPGANADGDSSIQNQGALPAPEKDSYQMSDRLPALTLKAVPWAPPFPGPSIADGLLGGYLGFLGARLP